MAIMDTHEAVKLLQSAGLDEEKAEAIVRVVGVGQDSLATKVDMEALALTARGNLQSLEQATKAELQAQATSVALESFSRTTAVNLEIFELRLRDYLTMRLGAMVFAAAGVQVVIVAFLLTQFLPN